MDTKRILIDYLDAKRPEVWQGFVAKLGVLILIAVVPGGLPLALSAYLYQRSKRATSAAAAHGRRATAFGNGASAFDKVYRALGHWE